MYMRTLSSLYLIAFLALVTPKAIPGQVAPASGPATLAGSVTDSATGLPVPRAHVCASFGSQGMDSRRKCVEVDSAGAFRLEELPLGRLAVTVACTSTRNWAELLHADSIEFTGDAPVVRHWRVETAGCDLMPRRTWSGVLRGHITIGFEDGTFAPCQADAGYYQGDSLATRLGRFATWVEFSDRARSSGPAWPELPLASSYRYYAQVRGTVTGPGIFGHLGMGRYQLMIDSVLAVRLPSESDCAAMPGEIRQIDPPRPLRQPDLPVP